MASLNDIGPVLRARLERAVTTLPTVLGVEAVNWYKDNFRRQGWTDQSFEKWKPRKKKDGGRGILIKSGRLARSPRLAKVEPLKAIVATDVPYAAVHNYGFSGTVRVNSYTRRKFSSAGRKKTATGRSFKTIKQSGTVRVKSHTKKMRMPARKFMGNSAVLRSILYKKGKIHLFRSIKG